MASGHRTPRSRARTRRRPRRRELRSHYTTPGRSGGAGPVADRRRRHRAVAGGGLAHPCRGNGRLHTLAPERDFVIDRLPDFCRSSSCWGRSRLQARLGPWADGRPAVRRRHDHVGRRARGVPDRPTSASRAGPADRLDGLTGPDAHCGPNLARWGRLCQRTATQRQRGPESREGGFHQRRIPCGRPYAFEWPGSLAAGR